MKSSDVAAPVTIYVTSNTAIDLIREEEKTQAIILYRNITSLYFQFFRPFHSIRDMFKNQQILIASLVQH